MNTLSHSSFGDPGPSTYSHEEAISPSIRTSNIQQTPHHYDGSLPNIMVSPDMSNGIPLISPGPHSMQHSHPMMPSQPELMQQYTPMPQNMARSQPPPMHPHRPNYVNYMHMPHHSHPPRADGHHMMGGDVFGGSMTEPGMVMETGSGHGPMPGGYEYGLHEPFHELPQGISPARALGPAPQMQPFATPSTDSHTTPTNNQNLYKPSILSSSSASSSTDLSSSVDRSGRRDLSTSDDENDSPTKRVRDRIPTFDAAQGDGRGMPGKKISTLAQRPQRGPPPQKPAPTVVGGRTSAKLTKVAEDPGVEGIPPGPRSMERPQQSFACIIGQAILKSSAGGLSLEHIYRYVETAYPYFKTVEQWRNSVRHNLSIHKIFITTPRTEKYPPGKGGIWIIDEAEKVHWPSEDKFIKNFPPSHPHHAVCRQTQHERMQEQRLREKAEAEGRVYVPKKGKKARNKMLHKEEGHKTPDLDGMGSMMADSSDHRPLSSSSSQAPRLMSLPVAHQPHPPMPVAHPMAPPPPPSSPPPAPTMQLDFEDESDFIPVDPSDPERVQRHLQFAPPKKQEGLAPPMAPPRVPIDSHRGRDDEDENVFSSGPRRVRLGQHEPLSPILEPQSSGSSFLHDDPDMFVTPSRARSQNHSAPFSSQHFTSSALKTPALIQTSSSPTSSPMPPTVTRGSHHPSSLQQAWTHDDMIGSTTPTSPAKLDAAFDLKPSSSKRDRDDDHHGFVHHVERGPPKTPVTRSSAAAERTPRVGGGGLRTPGMITKTPLTYGSPARAPPSASTLLSTPMWEISGVLERMNAESPTRTPRSDVPPTSPTHYSLSDCGDSPIAKRRKVTAIGCAGN